MLKGFLSALSMSNQWEPHLKTGLLAANDQLGQLKVIYEKI